MEVNQILKEKFYDLLDALTRYAIVAVLTVLSLTVYYMVSYGLTFLFTIIVPAITIFIFIEKHLKERREKIEREEQILKEKEKLIVREKEQLIAKEKGLLTDLLRDEYLLDYREHRFAPQNGACATLTFATHRLDEKVRAIKIFYTTEESALTAGYRLGEMRRWNTKRVVQFHSVDNLAYDPMRNALYNAFHIPVNRHVPILEVNNVDGDRRLLRWSRTATAEKIVYLTLKYMDKGCMELHLNELRHDWSLKRKLQYAKSLTTCLEYLHTKANKMHQNIKLPNILHNDEGQPILSDPGFVDIHVGQIQLFLSPEQENGALTVESSSDIYSLGLIFACLFTSHADFNTTNFVELMKKNREEIVVHDEYKISSSEARLIFNMLHDTPDMRPTSSTVKEELNRILDRPD